MTISLTRLSGGNTPADGSDPRTFPAIWNASATAIEGAIATIPEGGASVTVSETAPVSPTEGDLWLNSTEAKMYVYYDDGTSQQWVAAVGGTVPQQGKILQVVSTTKTTSFSTTSATFVDVTDLSVSITPSSTSNKILVIFDATVATSTTGNVARINLVRDSTPISQSTGSGTGDQSYTGYTASTTSGTHAGINFLDSPSSTSALTYKIQAAALSGATTFVGRYAANDLYRSTSSLTVMEVAG